MAKEQKELLGVMDELLSGSVKDVQSEIEALEDIKAPEKKTRISGADRLDATTVKNARGKEKTYKLMDGKGLYLQITPSGSKAWRYRYRINGKERTMSLGSYSEKNKLADARILRNEYKSQIDKGIDPLNEKAKVIEEQRLLITQKTNTLYWVALQYFIWKRKSGELNPTTLKRLIRRFGEEFTAKYGNTPIIEITKEDLKEVLLSIHTRGAKESSRRFYTQLLFFYDWALHEEYIETPIIQSISKKHLLPIDRKAKANYPIITDKLELGELLRDIDDAPCEYPTRQMLKIFPHVVVRPKNLREMEWNEISWDEKIWIIPKEKMKTGVTHVIPLTNYVLEILKETQEKWSSGRDLVFPSYRTGKVLSEATPNTCLSRIDKGKWKGKVVTHSFRGIFSTIANQDLQWSSKVIEASLAHSLSSDVEKAYNRADYLEERRKLHKWWTDYLLKLKSQP